MKLTYDCNRHASGPSPTELRAEANLREAVRHADSGQIDQALAVLGRAKDNSEAIQNARGVCLMRQGRMPEALRLFRSLALVPGGTWLKPGLPVIIGTNFSTVLLLTGHPLGCLEILGDIAAQDHPSVIRLRQTLARWQRGLSPGAWLMWKLGMEPNVPVMPDFVPGEFVDHFTAPGSTPPQTPHQKKAA